MAIDRDTALDMLATMAGMQDGYNKEVHPEWRTQGYEYYRAVWVECAELLDHFGWKWWKKQSPDMDQVKLEVVDIWHFGLSDLIRADTLDDSVGDVLIAATADATHADGPDSDNAAGFRDAVEALAQATLVRRAFDLAPFVAVLTAMGMSFTELFQLYVAKNVLNSFRQRYGYKTGKYVKNWAGREDNEHLMEVLAELTVPASKLPEVLDEQLTQRYKSLVLQR